MGVQDDINETLDNPWIGIPVEIISGATGLPLESAAKIGGWVWDNILGKWLFQDPAAQAGQDIAGTAAGGGIPTQGFGQTQPFPETPPPQGTTTPTPGGDLPPTTGWNPGPQADWGSTPPPAESPGRISDPQGMFQQWEQSGLPHNTFPQDPSGLTPQPVGDLNAILGIPDPRLNGGVPPGGSLDPVINTGATQAAPTAASQQFGPGYVPVPSTVPPIQDALPPEYDPNYYDPAFQFLDPGVQYPGNSGQAPPEQIADQGTAPTYRVLQGGPADPYPGQELADLGLGQFDPNNLPQYNRFGEQISPGVGGLQLGPSKLPPSITPPPAEPPPVTPPPVQPPPQQPPQQFPPPQLPGGHSGMNPEMLMAFMNMFGGQGGQGNIQLPAAPAPLQAPPSFLSGIFGGGGGGTNILEQIFGGMGQNRLFGENRPPVQLPQQPTGGGQIPLPPRPPLPMGPPEYGPYGPIPGTGNIPIVDGPLTPIPGPFTGGRPLDKYPLMTNPGGSGAPRLPITGGRPLWTHPGGPDS